MNHRNLLRAKQKAPYPVYKTMLKKDITKITKSLQE